MSYNIKKYLVGAINSCIRTGWELKGAGEDFGVFVVCLCDVEKP